MFDAINALVSISQDGQDSRAEGRLWGVTRDRGAKTALVKCLGALVGGHRVTRVFASPNPAINAGDLIARWARRRPLGAAPTRQFTGARSGLHARLGRGGAGHDRPQVSRRAIDASGWGGADLRRLIKSWRKAVIGVPRRRVSEVAWCFGNGSPRYHRALSKRSTAPLVRRVSPETGYADKRLHLLAPDGKDGNGAKQTGRQRSS